MNKKITASLAVVLFSALAMSSVSATTLSISTPDYGMRGMTLTVTVLSDGTPVQGADVYFVLNKGTPIHGQTDINGKVNYKPLLTGTLNITAIYGGISAGKEIPIYEPVYGVNLTVDGKKTASKTIYTTETARYTLTVRNTGNVTDTIDLTIDGIGTLNKTSVTLNPGASEQVSLNVSSTTAETYATTVTATSEGNLTKSDSVTVITTVEVTPTPTPYYGGGGGGGAAAPAVGAGETSVSTEPTGEVKTSVTAKSADAKAAVTIPAGTIAKDAAGKPLAKVTITPPSVLPAAPPATVSYVGYAYNFGPEGATFEPAIEISIEFDPTKFEGKTPVIYTYEAGKWVRLDTRIEDNKAIAKVDHFSTFVLFGEEKVVITPTPTPTATPTMPPVSPTPSPTPTPTPKPGIPGYEAVFTIAGLLAVAYLVLRRKRK